MSFPAEGINLFLMNIYGGFGLDAGAACSAYLGLASGLPQAGNPPYTVADFLAFYPQFFGPAQSVAGTVTEGSATISGIASTAGLQAGQLVTGQFPAGTVIVSTTADTITASNPALADDTTVSVYSSAPIPVAVIQAYLNLAYASLMSSRWREMWAMAMGWYIAHFLTLYAQSMAGVGATLDQIAAKGLELGIAVSQSAGAVSYTQQNLAGLESWGAWAKTAFGTQLVTHAQMLGAGMIYIR